MLDLAKFVFFSFAVRKSNLTRQLYYSYPFLNNVGGKYGLSMV